MDEQDARYDPAGEPVTLLPNPGEGGPVYDPGAEPVVPLPNPGEGGPVYDPGAEPVVPLPNPGEGGPVYDPGAEPVVPLPNPGEGGPVYDPGTLLPVCPQPGIVVTPVRPRAASVRFLHAGYGYGPFRMRLDNAAAAGWLGYGQISGYQRITAGYHTVTVTGRDGYIYIQKTLPFSAGTPVTVAVVNTAGGLDLLEITDACCPAGNGLGSFRAGNLARNSGPVDVLLPDGRTVYADVRFKEITPFKRIRPGRYQFLFSDTDLTPMPAWLDIETLDSAFIGAYIPPETLAETTLEVRAGVHYTVYLLQDGTQRNVVRTLTVADY